MNNDPFVSRMTSFREQYQRDPDAAQLTLKAKGSVDESKIVCKVETGRGIAVAGIHPKTGGSGLELCSGDMLLEALIACAGVSLKASATLLGIHLKSATVSAEGDIDLRGTLGVTEGVPVGFKEIRMRFDVQTDASQDKVNEMLKLTERFCVILNTLQNSPKFDVRLNTA